jgi:hypothetical protein
VHYIGGVADGTLLIQGREHGYASSFEGTGPRELSRRVGRAAETYFVVTSTYLAIANDRADIVFGDKGAGKTALYQSLTGHYAANHGPATAA